MHRRRVDQIERAIRRWEQIRDRLGMPAPYLLVRLINAEIDQLRHAKLLCTRPWPHGRRTSDQPRQQQPSQPH